MSLRLVVAALALAPLGLVHAQPRSALERGELLEPTFDDDEARSVDDRRVSPASPFREGDRLITPTFAVDEDEREDDSPDPVVVAVFDADDASPVDLVATVEAASRPIVAGLVHLLGPAQRFALARDRVW